MGKLEEIMDQREADERRTTAEIAKKQEKAEKTAQRNARLSERKEFNRLFKRLKTLVDGHWDRYGWGWKFKYKNDEYYIDFATWTYEKTPGDVDDYSSSGQHWILKRGFNASGSWSYTLAHEAYPKQGLTEAVLRGLKELQKRDGRRWE